MKTTIYELLGMIKDDIPVKRILFKNQVYEYDEDGKDYYNEEYGWVFDEYDLISILNEPIEILETTITHNQNDYIQYQPYTGDVEIKCNSAKNLWESDKTYKPDKIEKIDMFDYFTGYWYKELPEDFKKHLENNFEALNSKINEIIEAINERQD